MLDIKPDDLRLTFQINTLSHYYLLQEFLPHMIERNHGMVVTVASLAAYVTAPRITDYVSLTYSCLDESLFRRVLTRLGSAQARRLRSRHTRDCKPS